MKLKRYKRIRRTLQFYNLNHSIRAPYKVAVDGDFLQAALEGKVQVKEQLAKMFQAECSVFTTRCVLKDLESRGRFYSGAVFIANTLRFLKCRHKGIISPRQCIAKLLGTDNRDHLCIAAQDPDMRQDVRSRGGVPLLFVRGSVPVMENPTMAGKINSQRSESDKFLPASHERKLIEEAKPKGAPRATRPRKKAKGPNPLAMKKKKKKKQTQTPQPVNQPADITRDTRGGTQANGPTNAGEPAVDSVEREHKRPREDTKETTPRKTRKRKRRKRNRAKTVGEEHAAPKSG